LSRLSINETNSRLEMSKRRNPMLLQNLTLEEVSLTFQVLASQLPLENLPEHLQTLEEDQWEELAFLLDNLWAAQQRSSLH
jgi:hypothetical protein